MKAPKLGSWRWLLGFRRRKLLLRLEVRESADGTRPISQLNLKAADWQLPAIIANAHQAIDTCYAEVTERLNVEKSQEGRQD